MEPNTAQFRRANRQPGYQRTPRDEYLVRHHEFHKRGEALAKKLDAKTVALIRKNKKGLTAKQQAQKYGVHENTIYRIRHRVAWGCVK